MTPKQKAEKLTDSFLTASFGVIEEYIPVPYPFAKQCALISVNEVILEQCKSSEFKNPIYQDERLRYWNEVKQEIEKL